MSKDNDHVRAYAKEVVSLGLLLMEFVNAVREGDSDRIIRCLRYFLPYLLSVPITLWRHSICFLSTNTHLQSG